MASVIVVGTNTYISAADATAYFTLRLDAAEWTAATEPEKDAALVMATQAIDRHPWSGRKWMYYTQILAFPRTDVSPSGNNWLLEGVVPQQVKNAECEEALAILKHQGDVRLELMRLGLTGAMLDGASEQYGSDAGKGLLSVQAMEFMRPWIADVVNMI